MQTSNTGRIIAYLKRRKTPATVREVAAHLKISTDAARAALNYAAYRVSSVRRETDGWVWLSLPPLPPQVSKRSNRHTAPRP